MSATFTINKTVIATPASGALPFAVSCNVTPVRAVDGAQSQTAATTSGTPGTYTALDIGALADGEMFFALRNTGADNIVIARDVAATKYVIATVYPGELFDARIPSKPYVKSATASVTFDYFVANE